MTLEIDALAKTLLSESRKGFFRRSPVFKKHGGASPGDLTSIEKKIGTQIPEDLQRWILAVGFGDIGDEISFRKEWFAVIDEGPLRGGARFAQDILGNFYAFDSLGSIYYLSRSQPVFAVISKSFCQFIAELISRDYRLIDWVSTLETQGYEWRSQA